MQLTIEDYLKLREVKCEKSNKHKFRTNKFGITWCVICGMLGNHNVVSQPLLEEDKIEIIRK